VRAPSDGAIPAPYMAYLRVYEPLAAFPSAEREAWKRWLEANPEPLTLADEQVQSLRGLVAVPPIAVPEAEERIAYTADLDGVTLICPWQIRLRSWLALTELRASHGDTAVRRFWPQAVLDQADREYDEWWAEDPEALPHILTCSWQIPIRWLILFVQTEGVKSAGGHLSFRTPMVQARRRSARALRILTRTLRGGPLVEAVETLSLWLEEFHPLSLVELDYGGLMSLLVSQGALGADELCEGVSQDCSVRDVADGLAALASGDEDLMTAAYLRYRVKWDSVRLLGRAN
jgi:hypothetical protein